MPGLSQTYAVRVLEHLTGKSSLTMPTAYVALFTTAPTDSTSGTEVSGGSYARVRTSASDWASASRGSPSSIANANAITFPTATASWGDVVGFALMDASSSGNVIAFGTLTRQTVSSGVTASYAAGDLRITAA
jgi:hypothetical protein